VKSEFAFLYFAILGACDAVVTGDGRNQYIWKGIVSNSIFSETVSDALRSNYNHWRVAHFYALKIRRPSGLGGSTPPPGTNPQTLAGRDFQTPWSFDKCVGPTMHPKSLVTAL